MEKTKVDMENDNGQWIRNPSRLELAARDLAAAIENHEVSYHDLMSFAEEIMKASGVVIK